MATQRETQAALKAIEQLERARAGLVLAVTRTRKALARLDGLLSGRYSCFTDLREDCSAGDMELKVRNVRRFSVGDEVLVADMNGGETGVVKSLDSGGGVGASGPVMTLAAPLDRGYLVADGTRVGRRDGRSGYDTAAAGMDHLDGWTMQALLDGRDELEKVVSGLAAELPMAARLRFSTQPSEVVAGSAISPAVMVEVLDSRDRPVTNYRMMVVVKLGGGTGCGSLSGITYARPVDGVAEFPGLLIREAGDGYTLTASSGGLPREVSSSFNVLAAGP